MTVKCITSSGAFVKRNDLLRSDYFSDGNKLRIYKLANSQSDTLSLALETLSRAREAKGLIPLFSLEKKSFSSAIQEKPFIVRCGSFLSLYSDPAALDTDDLEDRSFSYELFRDPVKCTNGHVFERESIQEYLKTNNICPCCKISLANQGSLQEASEVVEKLKAYHVIAFPYLSSLFFNNVQNILGKEFIASLPWEQDSQGELDWQVIYTSFISRLQEVLKEIETEYKALEPSVFSCDWIRDSVRSSFLTSQLSVNNFPYDEVIKRVAPEELSNPGIVESFQQEIIHYYENLSEMFLEDYFANIVRVFDKYKACNENNVERTEKIKKSVEEWASKFLKIQQIIKTRSLIHPIFDQLRLSEELDKLASSARLFLVGPSGFSSNQMENIYYQWAEKNKNYVSDNFYKYKGHIEALKQGQVDKSMARLKEIVEASRIKAEHDKKMAAIQAQAAEEALRKKEAHDKKMSEMHAQAAEEASRRVAAIQAQAAEEALRKKEAHDKKMSEMHAQAAEEALRKKEAHDKKMSAIQAQAAEEALRKKEAHDKKMSAIQAQAAEETSRRVAKIKAQAAEEALRKKEAHDKKMSEMHAQAAEEALRKKEAHDKKMAAIQAQAAEEALRKKEAHDKKMSEMHAQAAEEALRKKEAHDKKMAAIQAQAAEEALRKKEAHDKKMSEMHAQAAEEALRKKEAHDKKMSEMHAQAAEEALRKKEAHDKKMSEMHAQAAEEALRKKEAHDKKIAEAHAQAAEEASRKKEAHDKKMAEIQAQAAEEASRRVAAIQAQAAEEALRKKEAHDKKIAEMHAQAAEEDSRQQAEHDKKIAEAHARIAENKVQMSGLLDYCDKVKKTEKMFAAIEKRKAELSKEFWNNFYNNAYKVGTVAIEVLSLLAYLKYYSDKAEESQAVERSKYARFVALSGPVASLVLTYFREHYNPNDYSHALHILGLNKVVLKDQLPVALHSVMKKISYLMDDDIVGFENCCNYLKDAFLTVSKEHSFSYVKSDIERYLKDFPMQDVALSSFYWASKIAQFYYLTKNKHYDVAYASAALSLMERVLHSLAESDEIKS